MTMDSTLSCVPRQNAVRAKDRALSCRERLHWKRELNQEFSADAAMLSLRHDQFQSNFGPVQERNKWRVSL